MLKWQRNKLTVGGAPKLDGVPVDLLKMKMLSIQYLISSQNAEMDLLYQWSMVRKFIRTRAKEKRNLC